MQGKCTVSWYVLYTSHDYRGFLVTLRSFDVDDLEYKKKFHFNITEQTTIRTFRAIVLCSPVVYIFPNHEIA